MIDRKELPLPSTLLKEAAGVGILSINSIKKYSKLAKNKNYVRISPIQ
jgi:hypothetical protein